MKLLRLGGFACLAIGSAAAGTWLGSAGATWLAARERVPSVSPAYLTLHQRYDAPVIFFSTSTCPYCRSARTFLDERGVRYRELAVDVSAEAAEAFAQVHEGAEVVPTFIVNGRKIVGYAPETVLASLSASAPH